MHRLTYTIIAQTQYEDKNSIIGFAVVLYILGAVACKIKQYKKESKEIATYKVTQKPSVLSLGHIFVKPNELQKKSMSYLFCPVTIIRKKKNLNAVFYPMIMFKI